jgi:membrane-associated protease RseP (regulator of RpoE activity)
LAVVGGAYYLSVQYGPHVPWQIAKAAIGLGVVIFLHELGHFAVAKWCDVHVEAFSLGFGPAIPGLSFRRGETLYKIAWVPLGGYVKMVGEGSENEEDENDPRSFKNKTVGQRMAIISAGVVMNVILGAVCFILAYQGGIKQSPAVVDVVEPGSPAWKLAIRSGDAIEHIGDVEHPYFEDLLFEVMLSREGQELRMVTLHPGDRPREFYITPRLEVGDSKPVIGIRPPSSTLVATKHATRGKIKPTYGHARGARALTLRPGDVVVAASDPVRDDRMLALPTIKDGNSVRTDYSALCQRSLLFAGVPLAIQVRHGDGTEEKVELPASGIEYDDLIVGTTDDSHNDDPYDPYKTAKLKDDPRNPEPDHPDFFEFNRRMQVLAGKPVVMQVRRHEGKDGTATIDVLVPPAFHQTIPGLRMNMGKVKAVRGGSPAQVAGVRANDRIRAIELTDGKETLRVVSKSWGKKPATATDKPLDPVRLAFDLREWAHGRTGIKATIVVARDDAEQHQDGASHTLGPVAWEEARRFDREQPLSTSAPTSIPELGLAYQIDTTVDFVEEGSAAAAELQEGDVVLAVSLKDRSEEGDKWGPELKLYQKKGEGEPWWASVASIYQDPEVKAIKLKVRRKTEELETQLELSPDATWPLTDRGIRLMPDIRLQKADSPIEAVSIGLRRTYQMIVKTYLSIRSIVTGRVSALNLRGPISIAEAAFDIAGEGFSQFMFFLAIISVNLAVINFLPIPVLDGGHMVFLIYEKLRGRPATEQVRVALTYVGLLLILSLMAFVIYLDVKRKWFNG